jgi:hypothetical protein
VEAEAPKIISLPHQWFGGKQYRYSRLCFGLVNTGNSFADLMNLVLSGLSLFQSSIELLGHKVSGKGVAPEDFKVASVEKWPQPNNVKALRSFLGFCCFYR